MSVNLKDYGELIDELPENHRQLLEAEWHEAARILSPRGLDNWLKSAAALHRMGRGGDIVAAWIEEVPGVAREVGEDVIPDFAQACLQFASRTSGAVIELVIATAPIAAKRLGDAELFRGYLQLLNVLLGQAARGLRPMLEHLDQLLGVLTLGGLRRWALWGAQAHRSNFDEQVRYFSLESEEAKAMLQKERKGTLFVDIHRRIGMYLRALWGRDFFMRPTAGDFESREGFKPFIADYFLHLPDAYDDWNGIAGLDLYRAAAAHCAAHVVATTARIDADRLSVLQQACVGLFEDARVETLAIRRFPRLKDFWAQFHIAQAKGESVGAYLNRIARALLDPGYEDADPLVVWAREGFANADLASNGVSIELGLELAEELMKRRLPFSPYHDVQEAPYRDDNRYLWEYEEYSYEQAIAAGFMPQQQVRKYVSVMEMVNEVEVETAGDDAQEIWVCAAELFDDDGISFNAKEGKEPVAEPRHYDEFDYHIQLARPAWATVLEKRPKFGDLAVVDAILAEHRKVTQRLKHLLDALQPQGVQRIRKLEEGDEIDINAAIRSLIDIRMGQQPDPRVMMRSVRKTRDIAVLVLLDLSESTNDKVAGQDYTVLELTRAATVLLGEAIHKVGDAFAVHGFYSDGRHNVFYQRYKDFEQPWNEIPKARLAGMEGRFSTRMGAAIRHAGYHLAQVRAAKKLLIVVTDGEPADIDVRDPQYLRYDAKKAVEDVGRIGVVPFCLTLDPRADQYVARIFGQRNFLILDHVERLPERLPQLYAGLTK
ncbi:nitric oxide reductase activation protein NorD [Sulfuricystis thermophila]|uniref:nitric oxide reductase activation protein NorD n=1 Tax=Sulfuricystis thermophila TaxID=2496847 RepID=UPI001036DCD2|nr:nitric oxide reductase activation protein NorD [Sulfuricystis thermophila]